VWSEPAVREAAEAIAIALSLMGPFTAEEMWANLGHKPGVALAGWPEVDPALLEEDSVVAILQVNGKIVDRIDISPNITDAELEKLGMENEKMKTAIAGAAIKKSIVRAPKLVNIVI
jgi:leucyl-tRNA synthetase